MRELLLLRHAKSSWENSGLADHERPLNDRGLRDAPRMGRLLTREGLVPHWIACSTAVRALATAELLIEACGYTGELHRSAGLYHAGCDDYLAELPRVPGDARIALLVGHNPVLEDLYFLLTGEREALPTAALVHLALPIESWTEAPAARKARTLHLFLPRELPA